MRPGTEVEGRRSSPSACFNFLVVLGKRIDRHNLTGLSAQISYYFALALFPFLILLAAIIGLLPFTHLWDDSLQRIIQYFPQDIQGVLWDTVASLVQAHTRYLSVGLVGTLWAACGGHMSLMSALNTVYEVPETRSYLRRLGIASLMVFVLIFLLVGSFGLLNAGSLFDQRLVSATVPPLLLEALAQVARWTISIAVTLVSIRLLDHVLPNLERPWRWMTPGSAAAAAGWLLGPLGFNYYIRHIASYNRTYGVLGAFVILMVWFYVSSLIVLTGAEINSQLRETASSREKPAAEFVPAPAKG
jgi:membrane protein